MYRHIFFFIAKSEGKGHLRACRLHKETLHFNTIATLIKAYLK
jgi:hypothetical protein